MPVVFVVDTQTRSKNRVRRMLDAANRAISQSLDLPRNSVWVRYDPGKPEYYWEGDTGQVPPQGRPVFVIVRLREGRDPKKIKKLYPALSRAVAHAFDMDPNFVWIRLEEMNPKLVGQGAYSYAELMKRKKK